MPVCHGRIHPRRVYTLSLRTIVAYTHIRVRPRARGGISLILSPPLVALARLILGLRELLLRPRLYIHSLLAPFVFFLLSSRAFVLGCSFPSSIFFFFFCFIPYNARGERCAQVKRCTHAAVQRNLRLNDVEICVLTPGGER